MKIQFDRRTLLRGAGSVAITLPWLEIMGETKAHAAEAAKRFLAVYTPGGTVVDKWRPVGTPDNFTLGPILKSLEPLKNHLVVLEGIDMPSAEGEIHQEGIVAWLTGTSQSAAHRSYAAGPSIDQVIAKGMADQKRRKNSLQMAIRWATGKSRGLLSPLNAANYEDNARFSPIPPSLDPNAIWQDLFGGLHPSPSTSAAMPASAARKKSILDFVGRRYVTVAQQLGSSDRQKLEQHLTKIREIEQGLDALGRQPARACMAPQKVDTSDYNPTASLNVKEEDDGEARDTSTDAAIPKVGKLMTDMMVMAMACDMTGVGTLQWSDTEANHTFPWLNLKDHHHFYQHDGGFRPKECEQIGTWYSTQHAYLLNAMANIDMGGHSLLDESVVFFGSELQDPPSHNTDNMPFLLAGGGGGLRGGRWLRHDGVSHNNLLVSILNLFGDERKVFGDPRFCTGPLPGLT